MVSSRLVGFRAWPGFVAAHRDSVVPQRRYDCEAYEAGSAGARADNESAPRPMGGGRVGDPEGDRRALIGSQSCLFFLPARRERSNPC